MKVTITSAAELARAIAARRKELGVTQQQLANLCNLSINGISKFESSKGEREMKLSTLLKISEILGFDLILEGES